MLQQRLQELDKDFTCYHFVTVDLDLPVISNFAISAILKTGNRSYLYGTVLIRGAKTRKSVVLYPVGRTNVGVLT